ncbi:hypothetical protein [Natrinema sp. HArc-T2]
MSTDRSSQTGVVSSWWSTLDRDWKSVVIGAMIIGVVSGLNLQIPW